MLAAKTTVPVLGVPVPSKYLKARAVLDRADAEGHSGGHLCHRRSRVQPMRALFAVAMLATRIAGMRDKLEAFREKQKL